MALKIVLRIADAECPAGKMASQIMRALQHSKEVFPDLRYWGEYQGKKKEIGSVDDLPAELKKLKPGNYSLSDTDDGEGGTEFRVSFRKDVVSFRLYREADAQNLRKECDALTELFRGLYQELRGDVAFPAVSSITVLDVEYPQPRPPRVWGAFDPWGLVDFFTPSQGDVPDAKLIQSLMHAPLPAGVERSAMVDLVLVNWLPLREDTLEKKLSRRCVWYYENGELQVDPSFNEEGDKVVDVLDNRKTAELTFYDAATQTGFKAIGFDPHDRSYETDKVEHLEKLVQKGSVSGQPLVKAYLVVSKREFAILLRPVARDHHLAGVVYADNSGQLWDPFPEGKWL